MSERLYKQMALFAAILSLPHEGMVITIEPFISNGASEVKEASDGWTLYTSPQFATAQFEHTMVVTRTGARILTVA